VNYEKGIVELLKRLEDLENEEAYAQVKQLELLKTVNIGNSAKSSEFAHQGQIFDYTLSVLERTAHRHAGVSFSELCYDKKRKLWNIFFTLKGMVFLFIGLILLISTGTVFASIQVQEFDPEVRKIHEEAESINRRIGIGTASPYYLSDMDPCLDIALDQLIMANIWITLDKSEQPKNCSWTYKDGDSMQTIAKDYWEIGSGPIQRYLILKREYFSNESLIAFDLFPQTDDCYKSRTYLNNSNELAEVCFSEAGILAGHSEINSNFLSPIPPMFYWFFYR